MNRHKPLVQLARIRRAFGLSQAALGAAVGCSGQFIAMLEAGYSPHSNEFVARIAGELGVDADALSAPEISINCNSVTSSVSVVTR